MICGSIFKADQMHSFYTLQSNKFGQIDNKIVAIVEQEIIVQKKEVRVLVEEERFGNEPEITVKATEPGGNVLLI